MVDILQYAATQRLNDAVYCNSNLKLNYISPTVSANVLPILCITNINSHRGLIPAAYNNLCTSTVSGLPGTANALPQLMSCWQQLCSNLLLCRVPTTSSCGLLVYDPTYVMNSYGCCCLWTVPSGVTFAQFQLWGPGGGISSVCCCSLSPWGSSGSYTLAGFPVVAGCQYTLCAGCAQCCYASQTTPPQCGIPTAVTGYNITCLQSNAQCYYTCIYNYAQCACVGVNIACFWSNLCCQYSNYMYTVNGGYCISSSACVSSDYSFSPVGQPCACVGTAVGIPCVYAYGIPGMFGRVCLCGGLASGFTNPPPVFGYTSCTNTIRATISSSTCAGCSNTSTCCFIPGMGSTLSFLAGGSDASTYVSYPAHGGAVCVTYC
jgi:hypothetical protein